MKLKFLFFSFFIFFIIPVSSALAVEAQPVVYYEKAIILELKETINEISDFGQGMKSVQEIKIKILSGAHKGEEKVLENSILGNPADLNIMKGDKVIIYLEKFEDDRLIIQIHDYYRLPQIILLVFIFFVLMILIGKAQGLRSIVSLLFSIFLIFKVFIPMALKGFNPVWLSLVIASIISITTLFIIAGFRKKTIAAILGTIGGLISAAILAFVFTNLSRLSGLSSEEARILASSFFLDFKGLLFSSIIIAALGAVMDVAISVASGIAEVKKANSEISRKKLISSGMEIGKDIIGTMSNTLIFAYVGASLFILLLFTKFGDSYLKFFNFDFVAEEIIGAISGSIGLILTVPITAFFAGYLESKK